MTIRRSEIATLLTAACLVLAAAPTDWKTPGKDWAKGPVRWIMTDDEEKDWKKLHTDDERAAFAKAFWEKRDPTPGTPANEYAAVFWKKVEEADKNFTSQSTPGCLTDMGRVFLLLGPPAKPDKDARGRTIWHYEPNEVTGIKEKFDLTFAPGMLSSLLLDRKELEEYVKGHPETRGIGWKIPGPAIAEGAPEVPVTVRKPEEDQSPESQRQIPILQELLAKGSGAADVPFQVGFDYYAAVDGTTLTAITIEAPREAAHGSGEVALHPFARLQPAGAGKPVNLTGDLPFVPAPLSESPSGSFVYQARHNLPPGSYTIAVVVEDKVVAGEKGTLVKTIDIPDFRNKAELQMSTITLVSGFNHLDAALGPDEKERGAGPYVLGSYRLVPRPAAALSKDEALNFYCQVYNPAPDPATGRPSLESTLTFYYKQDDGTWKRYRPPLVRALSGQIDLYSIDLKDLLAPNQKLPADFKMAMQIVDKVGGKELKREIPFSVR